jgi:hypothetical protein
VRLKIEFARQIGQDCSVRDSRDDDRIEGGEGIMR